MIISPPKTIEDFKAIRKTILELMANPYCDDFMFMSLTDRLDRTDAKIRELEPENKHSNCVVCGNGFNSEGDTCNKCAEQFDGIKRNYDHI